MLIQVINVPENIFLKDFKILKSCTSKKKHFIGWIKAEALQAV
jgi:hypothetical protein